MAHTRYFKNDNGTWSRLSLAFMHHVQFEERNPHVEHGLCSANRRTQKQSLPPRNYEVWPIFEYPASKSK